MLKNKIIEKGYAVLNIDIDRSKDLPPTPNQAEIANQDPIVLKAKEVLLKVANEIGEVITYQQMKQAGQLVQHVFPLKGMENSQTAGSSESELFWHTEHADKPIPPDYLVILCLRNESNTATLISKPKLENLSGEVIALLKEKRFISESSGEVFSVIEKEMGEKNLRLRFDPLYFKPIDKKAKLAFAELEKQVKLARTRVVLKPGQAVLIDNRLAAHGREAFRAGFESSSNIRCNNRWMMRAMIRQTNRVF